MTSPLRPLACLFAAASLIAVSLAAQAPAVAQPPAANAPGNPAYSAAVEAKIARITADVLPPIVVDQPTRAKVSLADRMQAAGVPGLSVVVINDGKVEWARGFGVMKVGGPPVTTQTMFAAASVSKPVSAFGALKLVQEGKVDLDTDVNRYLKSWKLPENEFTRTQKVTLRRLLTHTAGTTVHGFPGYEPGKPVPTLQQILDGQPPANSGAVRVDVTPGTLWRYSGGGFTVAQQLVIDITGRRFDDYQRTTVLEPLGMTNSSYEQPLPPAKAVNLATPYETGTRPVAGGARTDPSLMAAGLWTTPSDLALYVMEVQQAKAGRSAKVLNKKTVDEMLKGGGLEDWGLGPWLGGKPGNRWFAHDGGDPGFANMLIGYESGDGVIVMTNGDNGGQVAQALIRSIAREYGWADHGAAIRKPVQVSSDVMDGLVGSYQNARYSSVRITREGDQMFSQTTGQARLPIFASDAKTWFFAEADVQFIVDTDQSGKARSIISRRPQYDTPLTRLADADSNKPSEDLAARQRGATPDPRSEAAIRRMFDEVRRGQPDYARMAAPFAAATKQQISGLTSQMGALSPITSVSFKGVAPNGADIFHVTNGDKVNEWRVIVDGAGKVEAISLASANQLPGAEGTLRRVIESIAAGQPAYELMTPARAEFVRNALAQQSRDFAAYGPIETMRFVANGPQGGQMFEVKHANARVNWNVVLDADGKVASLGRQPAPATEEDRQSAFRANDRDGDGKIDKDGYRAVLIRLGQNPNQLESLFTQRDVNKDGFVSAEEYRTPIPQ